MNLYRRYLTKNPCYYNPTIINPIGIMVHSTGANNPNIDRYVEQSNGWNNSNSNVMCHAVIGLKDGMVKVCETLPYNYKSWHCAKSGNNTHISFEICEDDLTDENYFNAVYRTAVEYCAYLCKKLDIHPDNIICHSEGYKMGIASNHTDVLHWFPKFGKSMDTFRKDVKKIMEEKIYDSFEEIPDYARPAIQYYIENGALSGTGTGFNLTEDMLRTLVIIYRMMKG